MDISTRHNTGIFKEDSPHVVDKTRWFPKRVVSSHGSFMGSGVGSPMKLPWRGSSKSLLCRKLDLQGPFQALFINLKSSLFGVGQEGCKEGYSGRATQSPKPLCELEHTLSTDYPAVGNGSPRRNPPLLDICYFSPVITWSWENLNGSLMSFHWFWNLKRSIMKQYFWDVIIRTENVMEERE